MDFDQAFAMLIKHEGGYVNHPSDPGGETNYGISKRSYPSEDIKGMTLERAREIYKRDFWGPAGCDVVPEPLKFDLFDTAVNSGVRRAVMLLQTACFAHPDGVLGNGTQMALRNMEPFKILARFNGLRLRYMCNLGNWDSFSKGWARRIADNLTRE